MLTSFFRKSSPINFLIVLLPVAILYILFNFTGIQEEITLAYVGRKLLVLGAFLLSLFIINFILLKDKYEGRHTYVLFLFALFCISIPGILMDENAILAGLFIIIGLNRSLGIQTGEKIGQKIFDTYFFFSIAALFFPPAIIFMIFPFFSISFNAPDNFRFWLIPIPAILSVLILKISWLLISSDTIFNPIDLFPLKLLSPEDYYATTAIYYPLFFILLLVIWASVSVLINRSKSSLIQKKVRTLLFILLGVATAVVLFSEDASPNKGNELLFFYIPTALILGKYFENKDHQKFKEVLLWLILMVCISLSVILKWELI